MSFAFVIPPGHGHLSGENLTNERLARLPGLDVRYADDPRELRAACTGRRHLLVDSSYLFRDDLCSVLWTVTGRRRVYLMVHGLPSLFAGWVHARREHLDRELALLPRFSGAIVASRFMAGALSRRGMNPQSIATVGLAPVCDGRERKPPASSSRRRKRVSVLTVANWAPWKGIHYAVDALGLVHDLEWRWTLIGRSDAVPGYGETVHKLMSRRDITGRARVLDSVPADELARAYPKADIFLLPSIIESYGLAFAEALSHGLPTVGFSTAAAPEVTRGGALLTPCPDIVSLANTLRALITDPEARSRASVQAANAARLLPTWADARTDLEMVLARFTG